HIAGVRAVGWRGPAVARKVGEMDPETVGQGLPLLAPVVPACPDPAVQQHQVGRPLRADHLDVHELQPSGRAPRCSPHCGGGAAPACWGLVSLQVGIVGLPNVGKSTLFNAVSAAGAEAANYPFATIDPNVGVVAVPDPRLDRLAELSGSAKVVPATIEFL